MTEDERQYLLRTVAETHARLTEVALKLRLELPPKAPALKTVLKAEREIFRLKRELQRLDIEIWNKQKVASYCLRFAGAGRWSPWTSCYGKTIDMTSHEWGHLTKRENRTPKSHPNGRSWLTTALSPRIILLCRSMKGRPLSGVC